MTFIVLKPEYPHDAATNALFSIEKGEILECPANYEPSDSFQVCETKAAAAAYIKMAYARSSPVTERKSADKIDSTPSYPLFRKVAGLGGEEETSYQLFSRDVHRFLSREEKAVIADIEGIKMNHNTVARLLEYEKKHFSRKNVVAILETKLKSDKTALKKDKGLET